MFVLRAVEGMSIAETAEALSIRPETVKTRFHRARHRLQETLGARLDALMPVTFDFGGERCDRIVAAVLARLRPSFDAARHAARRSEAALPDDPQGGSRFRLSLPQHDRALRKEPSMQKPLLATAAIALFALTGAACTSQAAKEPPAAVQQAAKAPPGGDYQKVSDLVALPEFIPGLGALYVQPATLPAGPFLAYDRDGRLVSTIYMIPLADIEAQKKFDGLAVGAENVVDRRHVLQRRPSGRRAAALSRRALACARERCQAPIAALRVARAAGRRAPARRSRGARAGAPGPSR